MLSRRRASSSWESAELDPTRRICSQEVRCHLPGVEPHCAAHSKARDEARDAACAYCTHQLADEDLTSTTAGVGRMRLIDFDTVYGLRGGTVAAAVALTPTAPPSQDAVLSESARGRDASGCWNYESARAP